MNNSTVTAALAGAVLTLGACSADTPRGPVGRLDIAVAPLDLPNVGRVCFDLEVDNGLEQKVWGFGTPGLTVADGDDDALCSDRYGNGAGGDLAYVGTCDGDAPDHTVRLWIDSIEDQAGNPLDDWRDPCPATGCALEAECVPNTDTAVTFDLVVMRQANQGFFDVAVNFEDIFCSAKVDCTYDEDGLEPITLLHQADGTRGQTAVIGFACTGGPGNDGTTLHVTDVSVDCGGGATMLVASVPLTTGADGEAFGFNVNFDPSLGNVTQFRLDPVVWDKVGEGEWATSTVLPLVPTYDSAEIVDRLDADHLYGVFFDADGALNVGEFRGGLAIWERQGGAWQVVATTPAPNGLEGFSSAFVTGYDDALGRLYIGGSSGAISAYWDWRSGNPAVSAPTIDEAAGFCQGRAARGDVVYFGCEYGLYVWRLDTGLLEALPLPFTLGDDYVYTAAASVRGNGDVFAVVTVPNGGYRGLVYWQRSGGTYVASELETRADPEIDERWADGDFVFTSRGGVSELTQVFGVGGDDNFDVWTQATLDGTPIDGWILSGIAKLPSGDRVVFGWLPVEGASYPIAALLPSPSDPIAFMPLPTPDGADGLALNAYGTNGDRLVLFGADRRFAGERQVSQVWFIDPSIGELVADWRVLGDTPQGYGFPDIDEVWHPLHPVSTIVMPQQQAGPALAWDLDTTGEPGTVIAAGVLPTPAPSGEGGAPPVSLDPTVLGRGWDKDPEPGDAVWAYQVSRGAELLQCNGQPCNKLYWNTMIGFDPTVPGCTLHFAATASDGAGFEDGSTPYGTTYPYIAFDVALTDDSGAMVCRQNPLDRVIDAKDGVRSLYTGFEDTVSFCHHYDGESLDTSPGCGQNR